MDRDEIYLRHIVDAVISIEEYLAGYSQAEFLVNGLLQAGVMRQLEIIGEAAKRVSAPTKSKLEILPWKVITGMRDKLIHDYFSVDLAAVWKTVQEDLPLLKSEINAFLTETPKTI